jgi:hypothetical protein
MMTHKTGVCFQSVLEILCASFVGDVSEKLARVEYFQSKVMFYIYILSMFYICHYRINAFLEGFYDIIPKRLISIFNEQELELLISGLPNVDIEDLRANTEYHKYQPTSLQVRVVIWAASISENFNKLAIAGYGCCLEKIPAIHPSRLSHSLSLLLVHTSQCSG